MSETDDTRHEPERRLSEYLDGELSGGEAEAAERHLSACAACRAVLEELDAVRARGRSLADRLPERDLWPGIRDGLGQATVIDLAEHLTTPGPRSESARRRRVVLSLPQLGAAAAALVVLAGAGTWGVARTVAEGAPPADAGEPGPAAGPGVVAPAAYGNAPEVAELQEVLRLGRDRLSPGTVRILEKNLILIDTAIRESAEALAVDPGNPFVERHLQRSMERKVAYLREAAALLEDTD